MPSVVDICNLALGHFGDKAAVSSISPPDGSAQADHCARFYPIARDALLEMHAWSFATRRVALVETTDAPLGDWAYCYAYPNSCARLLGVLAEGQADDSASEYHVVETTADGRRVILSNTEAATARFTALMTDPTRFTPLFVTSLSFLLGSYLAGPITKDRSVVDSLYRRFLVEFGRATNASANTGHNPPTHTPGMLSARGFVAPRPVR